MLQEVVICEHEEKPELVLDALSLDWKVTTKLSDCRDGLSGSMSRLLIAEKKRWKRLEWKLDSKIVHLAHWNVSEYVRGGNALSISCESGA